MKKAKKKLAYLPVCEACAGRPAFLSQNEFELHRMKFHQSLSEDSDETSSYSDDTSPGIVQGIRKTAKRISELLGSKQKLKQELKDTKAEVKKLDTLSGTQEHTVRLLKEEVENLERKYVAKNLEIARLKSEADMPCQEGIPKHISKIKSDHLMCCQAEGFRKNVDAENLCLLDSMQKFTSRKHEFKSVSTELSSDEEIRKSNMYKKSKIMNMSRQIKTLQYEVDGLKSHKNERQQHLEIHQTSHNDIIKAQQEANEKLLQKSKEVEDCKKEIRTLKDEVEGQKLMIQKITKESLTYQEKYKTLKLKTIDSNRKVATLYSEVGRLSGINDTIESQIQDLRSTLDTARCKIVDKEDSIRKLSQREQVLKAKIKEINMDMEERELLQKKDSTRLNNLNQVKQCKIEELTFEIDLLNKENLRYKEQLQSTSEKEHQFEEQIRKLELDKTSIARERNNLKSQIERIKEGEESAKSSLQELQELNGSLAEENKAINNQKMNLKREVWSLKGNFNKMKSKFSKKNYHKNAITMADLQTRKEDIQDIKEDLDYATKHYHAESERFLKENSQLREEIKEQDSKMVNIKTESKHIQDGLLKLIDQLKEKRTSHPVENPPQDNGLELRNKVQSLQKSFEDSKTKAEEQEIKFNKLIALHQKLDDELIRVSNEKFSLEEEYCKLQKELEDLNQENSNLRKQIEQSSAMVKEISNDLEKSKQSEGELLRKLEVTEKEKNERIHNLQETIQNLKKNKCYSVNQIKNEPNETNELKRQLGESKEKITELEQKHCKLSVIETDGTKEQNEISKLELFQVEISQLTSETEELRVGIKKCEADRETLKKQMETGKKKDISEINKLKTQIQKSTKEKEQLGKRLNDSLTAQTALSAQIEQLTLRVVSVDNLRNELKSSEAEKKKLKDQLEQGSAEQRTLKTKLEDLAAKSSQDKNTSKNDDKIKYLDDELKECQMEKHQLKIELEESQAAQRTLQMKLDEMDDEASTSDEVENWKNQLEESNREKHKLKVELEESSGKQRLLQSKLNEMLDESEEESENEKMEELRHQLSASKKENESVKLDLEKAQLKLESKFNEDDSINEEMQKLIKENEALQQQVESNKRSMDINRKNREGDFTEIQTLKFQLEEARMKILNANANLDAKNKEVAELKRQNSQEASKTSDLQKQLQEARKTVSRTGASGLEHLTKENESLRKDLVDLRAKLKKTNGQLDEKNERINEMTNKINNIIHSENELVLEHNTLKQQFKDKQHEVKSHKLEIRELNAKLNSNETDEEKDDKIMQLKVKIQDLREDAKDLQNELNKKKQELNDKSYELGIIKSKTGTTSKQTGSGDLQKEVESVKQELEKQSDLLETANDELDRKNAKIKELRNENDIMLEQMKALHEEKNDEVEDLEQMILNCQRQYGALEQKYHEDMQSNPNPSAYEVAQLKTICQDLEDENTLLKQTLNEIHMEKEKANKMSNKLAGKKTTESSKGDETIDWNAAYRSFSPQAHMDTEEPQLGESDESLNLRIPSQASHFMMHGKETSDEDYDEDNILDCNPELAARINSIKFIDERISDDENNDKRKKPNMDSDFPTEMQYDQSSAYDFDGSQYHQYFKKLPEQSKTTPTTNTTKKEGKKKDKKKKREAKTKTELAPLNGPLPPLRGNADFKSPAIPPIGGNQKIPAAKPIDSGLSPQQKKVSFNFQGKPLDSKPLPGLKVQRSEQEAFVNKYSPTIKKLDPPKPLPGPDPHIIRQFHQHAPSSPHFDYYLKGAEDDYMNGEEDVDALVEDLDRTNVKLDRIRHIQNQFY